jgi:hypothetical protein
MFRRRPSKDGQSKRSKLWARLEPEVQVYFDDSLPALAEVVASILGSEALSQGVAIRDTSGRLCFFTHTELPSDLKVTVSAALAARLGAYGRIDRILADITDFGAATFLESDKRIPLVIEGRQLQLIDNRLVGADWLRSPKSERASPPRFVFASLKGGVGRSTALSVVATDAASKGKRVLAVDLDLEAPGLSSILLSEQTTPKFGMIDALVEARLAPLSIDFLNDLVSASNLTDRGRVDVLPALGRRCLDHPEDVLAKLARAYIDVVSEDGEAHSLLDQVSYVIDHVVARENYDLVLIDSRAGLHETAASALLGLGAELLCFGLDEPQTFMGYRALFSHIRRYSREHAAAGEWLGRVNLVQGKAPLDPDARADFARRAAFLLTGLSIKAQQEVPLPDGFGNVEWDDAVSDEDLGLSESLEISSALAVLYDDNFRGFVPSERRDQLSEAVYKNTFGSLIEYIYAASEPW